MAREEDVQEPFQQVITTYGDVDILVNCAGVVAVKPFGEMGAETWDRVLSGINLEILSDA